MESRAEQNRQHLASFIAWAISPGNDGVSTLERLLWVCDRYSNCQCTVGMFFVNMTACTHTLFPNCNNMLYVYRSSYSSKQYNLPLCKNDTPARSWGPWQPLQFLTSQMSLSTFPLKFGRRQSIFWTPSIWQVNCCFGSLVSKLLQLPRVCYLPSAD